MNKKEKFIFDDTRKSFGLATLAKSLQPYTKQILGKRGFVEIDVLTNWDKIIGDDLAQYSIPVKIDFQKNEKSNGRLFINVPSGAFAIELELRQKIIIEKVNTYFGYNAVSSIRLIQNAGAFPDLDDEDPVEEKILISKEEENFIDDISKDIENDKLREILAKLGKSVFNNTHLNK